MSTSLGWEGNCRSASHWLTHLRAQQPMSGRWAHYQHSFWDTALLHLYLFSYLIAINPGNGHYNDRVRVISRDSAVDRSLCLTTNHVGKERRRSDVSWLTVPRIQTTVWCLQFIPVLAAMLKQTQLNQFPDQQCHCISSELLTAGEKHTANHSIFQIDRFINPSITIC